MTSIDRVAPRRLLASIHDVGPRFDREVDTLAELLSAALDGEARFAMLVVPDHWGDRPLEADRVFQRRLRGWSDAGVEMFVHGWFPPRRQHTSRRHRPQGALHDCG